MTPEEQSIHLVGKLAKLERDLEQERQDRKQADLDTIRALGERNAERALADRLALALDDIRYYDGLAPGAKQPVTEALAAWKEARK